MTIKDFSEILTIRVCNLRKGDIFRYQGTLYRVICTSENVIIYGAERGDRYVTGHKFSFGAKNQMKVELILSECD